VRIIDRWTHSHLGRQVDDDIEDLFGEQLLEHGILSDVGLNQTIAGIFEVIGDIGAFDLRIVEIVEIVDDDDPGRMLGQQAVYQMTAYESCPAGDQKSSVLHGSTYIISLSIIPPGQNSFQTF
jgi:hypothetical protein